jgi:hypothetical protein
MKYLSTIVDRQTNIEITQYILETKNVQDAEKQAIDLTLKNFLIYNKNDFYIVINTIVCEHRFEPRYEEVDRPSHGKIYYNYLSELRQFCTLKKYVCDICIKCGMIIKRHEEST